MATTVGYVKASVCMEKNLERAASANMIELTGSKQPV
jgi:hypothetical protein